jgi:uncharacterized UPF0160 family protein
MLKRTDEFADAGTLKLQEGRKKLDFVFLIFLISSIDIIRSREPTELAKCDILVDVGAVYEPATHRYDHHQAGFTTTFDDQHKIKLSSAGLVYKYELHINTTNYTTLSLGHVLMVVIASLFSFVF